MAKCIDCGFLAVRDYESRQLAEVDSDFRRSGTPTAIPGSKYHSQERAPICFAQSVDLQAELLGALEPDYPPRTAKRSEMLDAIRGDLILELLHRERPECDSGDIFTRWRQGLSPKEHREMLDRQWMLDREDRLTLEMRRREDARDAVQRQWQKKQESAAQKRHDEQEGGEQRRHRRELWVFGGVIAVATIVAALIEVLFGGDVTVNLR